MRKYLLCHTAFCQRCIKSAIADEEDIAAILSDPHNHTAKRQYILELVRDMRQQKEEHQWMGWQEPMPSTDPDEFRALNVMDT